MFKQSCKRQNEKSVCFTGIVGVSSECQINQRPLENLLEKHHNNMQSLVLREKKKKKEKSLLIQIRDVLSSGHAQTSSPAGSECLRLVCFYLG